MTITASNAQQIIRLLNEKVRNGFIDGKDAQRLAVIALQEVSMADDEEGDGDDKLLDDDAPEPVEPTPPVSNDTMPSDSLDPSTKLLSLLTQFESDTAELWQKFRGQVDQTLKGTSGAAFPMGDFDVSSEGNSAKLTVRLSKDKGTSAVDITLNVDRKWLLEGVTPPSNVQASVEPSCHLPLRKQLLAFTDDVAEFASSELAFKRFILPEKTIAHFAKEAEKEHDTRVLAVLSECPTERVGKAWTKWCLAAQVYLLGSDYSDKKKFKEFLSEVGV